MALKLAIPTNAGPPRGTDAESPGSGRSGYSLELELADGRGVDRFARAPGHKPLIRDAPRIAFRVVLRFGDIATCAGAWR